jgi:hypothetical protein
MRTSRTLPIAAGIGAAVGLPAHAAELAVKLELPQIETANYQRPYMAMWLEKADDSFVSSLALWHRVTDRRGEPLPNGDRWMNTLREWWKQSASTSQMPIDGVSSATRAAGEHDLTFTVGKAPLAALPPGKYQLAVEVAREVKGPRPQGAGGAGTGPRQPRTEGTPTEGGAGGQRAGGEGGRGPSKDAEEVLRIPFEWPVKKAGVVEARGKAEIGAVSLSLKP